MNIRAITALGALAGAVSLTACGGGSSGVNVGVANTLGQSMSVRFVNGSPDIGTVDLYFTSNNSAISSFPTTTLAYGQISDFVNEPAVNGTITLRPQGVGNQALPPPCTIQNVANNGIYTVVIGGSGSGGRQCLVYHDLGFNGNGQVRFHHASPNAANAGLSTLALGTVPQGSGPGTQAQQIANATGAIATGGTVDVPGFSVPSSGALTFAVGPVSATFTARTTYNASALVAPGGTTAVNSAGTVPGASYNNASLFAIDCTGSTTPQGTPCSNGVGLIGSFDSK